MKKLILSVATVVCLSSCNLSSIKPTPNEQVKGVFFCRATITSLTFKQDSVKVISLIPSRDQWFPYTLEGGVITIFEEQNTSETLEVLDEKTLRVTSGGVPYLYIRDAKLKLF